MYYMIKKSDNNDPNDVDNRIGNRFRHVVKSRMNLLSFLTLFTIYYEEG